MAIRVGDIDVVEEEGEGHARSYLGRHLSDIGVAVSGLSAAAQSIADYMAYSFRHSSLGGFSGLYSDLG